MSRTIELEDFHRWNRVCHTRKTQDKYQALVKEAQDRNVDVRDILTERKFNSWAEFADSCGQFPLRCRLKEFSELGSGWVLYFYFLRFMMAVMFIFVIMHFPILIIYATHGSLEEWSEPHSFAPEAHPRPTPQGPTEPVPLTWMARLSPGSLGVQGASPALVPFCYTIGSWLLCILIAFMYALVHKIDQEVDLETTHPNDFAILVEGLPSSAKEEHVIKEFFQENAVAGRRVEVVKVVIAWNVGQFEPTAKELKKLRDRRVSLRISGEAEEADLGQQIQVLENRLDLSKGGAAELKSAGIAIVVFRKQADQVACLARWHGFAQRWFYKTPGTGGLCSLLFGDAQPLPKFPVGGRPLYAVKVSRAPNPTDINWRDAGRSTLEYVLRKAATIVALIVLLLGSYIMVFLLTRESRKGQAAGRPAMGLNKEYVVSLTLTSLLPATAITIINVLLMLAARWFGEREVHLTKTGEAAAITWYMTVAMVLNGAVVLWNVSAGPPSWFTNPGLVSDMYAMLAINFIFPPLMFLMDYELALNWFWRRRLTDEKLKELNLELDKYRDKEEAADRDMFRYVEEKVRSWEVCFEPTIMDLPRHYANAEKTYYCCLIYMALMPLAPLVGFLSLLFQYVNDKWMLLRYCRRPSVVQNAEAALEGLMRMRFVLPWLLPIMMVYFLRPCFKNTGALSIATVLALLPGIVLILVPINRLAFLFRWAMPAWLQDEKHRRGSTVDETTQDYYQAQHLWPKERKYHKTHFLYSDLPEELNPENLTPDSAEVKMDALVGKLVDLPSKPSRRRDRRARGDARPSAFRGQDRGRVVSPLPRERGHAAVREGRVVPVPDIIGVSEDSASTGRWEYEARGAFKAFEDDCQGEVERLFQEYQSGGQQRVTVKTGKIEISLDFKLMTSRVVGSKTVRQIRRL